jgi:hypothetical protein
MFIINYSKEQILCRTNMHSHDTKNKLKTVTLILYVKGNAVVYVVPTDLVTSTD